MARTRKITDILQLPVLDSAKHFQIYSPAPSETLTYTNNGMRRHTLALDSIYREEEMWTPDIYNISAEFVSVVGNVTDEFYGEINDFKPWFLGKVNRGEQFFVLFLPGRKALRSLSEITYRMTAIEIPFGRTLKQTDSSIWLERDYARFQQNPDMTWSLVG